MKRTPFLAFILFLVIGLNANVCPAVDLLTKLRTSVSRPPLSEVLKVVQQNPDRNPFLGNENFLTQNFELVLPGVIAQLESYYPRATYVCVGRDMAALGDMLSGFYSSLGQKNRVLSLDASSDTIRGSKKEDLLAYLKEKGLTFDRLGRDRPLIFIDYTDFHEGSQIAILLSTVHGHALRNGADPKKLSGIINAISLHQNSESVVAVKSADELSKLRGLEPRLIDGVPIPSAIPRLDLGSEQMRFAVSYTAPWHESFSAVRRRFGFLSVNPGEKIWKNTDQVLYEQWQIAKAVTSNEFSQKVFQALKTYEVDPSQLSQGMKVKSCQRALGN